MVKIFEIVSAGVFRGRLRQSTAQIRRRTRNPGSPMTLDHHSETAQQETKSTAVVSRWFPVQLLLLLTPIRHTPRPVTQRDTQGELTTKPPTLHRTARPQLIHPSSNRTTQHTTPDPDILATVVLRRAVSLGALSLSLFLFTCVSVWRMCAALSVHCPISCFFSFDTERLRVSSLMRGCNSVYAQCESRWVGEAFRSLRQAYRYHESLVRAATCKFPKFACTKPPRRNSKRHLQVSRVHSLDSHCRGPGVLRGGFSESTVL